MESIGVIIPRYTERYQSTLLAAEERTKAARLVTSVPTDDFLQQASERYELI